MSNKFNQVSLIIKIKDYVSKLGYSVEVSERFEEMYIKEMNHLIDMHNKIGKLTEFNKVFLGKSYNKEEFTIKDNQDLLSKTINNVNRTCRQVFNNIR